jgi:hypothetical protein
MTLGMAADSANLALLSCHRNGWVRAAAVSRFGSGFPEIEVPFLLLRTTDWVPEVRSLAETRIRELLIAANAPVFVQCFGLIGRLHQAGRARVPVAIHTEIEDLLRSPECAGALHQGSASPFIAIRRRSLELAVSNPGLFPSEVLWPAMRDGDSGVRKHATTLALRLLPQEQDQVLQHAAQDPYAPIRRIAFEEIMRDATGVPLPFPQCFLLDPSPAIRHEAQAASRDTAPAPAEFYRLRLAEGCGGRRSVAVAGLGETGNASDLPLLTTELQSSSSKVRQASLAGLKKLRPKGYAAVLQKIISSDMPKVALQAADTLLDLEPQLWNEAWAAVRENPRARTRISALRLLDHFSKRSQLRLCLEGLGDPCEEVVSAFVEKLSWWVGQSNRSFARAGVAESGAIQRALADHRWRIPDTLAKVLDEIIRTM